MTRSHTSTLLAPITILLVIFSLIIIVNPPFLDFPLNDSWAYAKSVQNTLNGSMRLSEWIVSSSVFHILLGTGITALFGFSFTTLRVLTIILSFIGSIGFYNLLRELKIRKTLAILGTITLIFNPLYIYLSYTYMTEITSLTLMIYSWLFYIKGLRSGKKHLTVTGSLLASALLLTRQLGIFIPISAVIFTIINKRKEKGLLQNIFYILIIPAICIVSFYYWYNNIHGQTLAYKIIVNDQTANFIKTIIYRIPEVIKRTAGTYIYISLFLLPLLLGVVEIYKKHFLTTVKKNIGVLVLSSLLLISFVSWQAIQSNFMPYFGNIITVSGFFPDSLMDSKMPVVKHTMALRIGLTAVGLLTAILLTHILWGYFKRSKSLPIDTIIYLSTLFFFLSSIAYTTFYDRYIITLLPGFIALTAKFLDKFNFNKSLIIVALVFLGALSLTLEKDYLSWNKARWQAGKLLLKRNIPISKIDGGFEWNGWYFFEEKLSESNNRVDKIPLLGPSKAKYSLSFPPKTYNPDTLSIPYNSPIGNRASNRIFILERP